MWGRFRRSLSISLFGSGLTLALKLVQTALLTRMLSMDDFGRVLIVINLFVLLEAFVGLRLSDVMSRFMPPLKERGEARAVEVPARTAQLSVPQQPFGLPAGSDQPGRHLHPRTVLKPRAGRALRAGAPTDGPARPLADERADRRRARRDLARRAPRVRAAAADDQTLRRVGVGARPAVGRGGHGLRATGGRTLPARHLQRAGLGTPHGITTRTRGLPRDRRTL